MDKICNTCKTPKPIGEFQIHFTNKDGKAGHCNSCDKVKVRRRTHKKREKIKLDEEKKMRLLIKGLK